MLHHKSINRVDFGYASVAGIERELFSAHNPLICELELVH